jgi:hypothetical protein
MQILQIRLEHERPLSSNLEFEHAYSGEHSGTVQYSLIEIFTVPLRDYHIIKS